MNHFGRSFLVIALSFASANLFAQWAERPKTGSTPELLPDRTMMAGMSGLQPELKAALVNRAQNINKRDIVIRAEVWGARLVLPQSNRPPKLGEATLSFVLDTNPPVLTDQREYTFSNVSPGWHSVTVRLVSSGGYSVSPYVLLGIDIPK